MTSINLYQSSSEGEVKNDKKVNFLDGTFIISMGIFLLVVLASFGTNLYVQKITKENDALTQQVATAESLRITSKSTDSVKDFQGRLDVIAKRNEDNVPATDILAKTAAAMVNGVMINKYAFDEKDGKLELTLWADDYRKVASQLFNFKKVEFQTKTGTAKTFSQVEVGGIKRGERGIDFDVTMVVNN